MWNAQDDYFHQDPLSTADGSMTPWDEKPVTERHAHDATSFPERAFDHLEDRLERGAPATRSALPGRDAVSTLRWMSVDHHPTTGSAGGASASSSTPFGQDSYTLPLSPGSLTSPSTTAPPGSFGILTPSNNNASSTNDGDVTEDMISQAIEEDKRRRNTAASARFRLKKKEREAELERSTKDMSRRCDDLQKRVSELETENRWLRELITERTRNRRTRVPAPLSPKAKSRKTGNGPSRTKTSDDGERLSAGEESY